MRACVCRVRLHVQEELVFMNVHKLTFQGVSFNVPLKRPPTPQLTRSIRLRKIQCMNGGVE